MHGTNMKIFRHVHETARRWLLAASCPSVRPHGTSWLPMDGFSWNSIFGLFFENMSREFRF